MSDDQKIEDLIIVGSGPAGYTAAIYAARAKLEPLLFEGFYSGPSGGQLMTTTDVENFPGFPDGITGPRLMEEMKAQAKRFGTKLLPQDVKSVDLSVYPYQVNAKQMHYAKALIIASGATAKRLDIPGCGEGEFWQKGVSACAVCDGAMPLFRDKELFVIGGGDSAVEEALYLTKFASTVHLVHRRDTLRASKIMADRLLQHPKVKVHFCSQLERVEGATAEAGKGVVKKVFLREEKDGTSHITEHSAAGVFFAIGHTPNTKFLSGQIALDSTGYIVTTPGTAKTSVKGVFAAGDVQDAEYRQAVTAAGSGCMAALEAERYLSALD